MVFNFDDMSEFIAAMPATAEHGSGDASDWNGQESFNDAKINAIHGRSEGMNEAEKMIDSINAENVTSCQQSFVANVAGALPIVPAAIAGSPFSMLQKVDSVQLSAPIRVFASCATSAGISAADMSKRGAAIIALILKLQEVKPVQLFIIGELEGSQENGGSAIPCVRIETTPLDTTAASYALTSAAFLRQLCFEFTDSEGFNGSWAYRESPQDKEFQDKIKAELFCTENDLYIRGGYASDKSIQEPAAWVQDRLNELIEREVF
jgi:hypothetical protein